MAIETITNYLQATDRIASSGQPDDYQFKDISGAGYTAVINLAMPDSMNAIPEEGYIVTSLKMTYVHIPVPFEAPELAHLRAFIKTMAAFSEQKVWVHCVVNYRVSAFLYQYQRIVHGEPAEKARNVMLASWEPNAVWQRFMEIPGRDIVL